MVKVRIKRQALPLLLVLASVIIIVGFLLFSPLFTSFESLSDSNESHILPLGYKDEVVVSGLERPIGLSFLPDGRILFVEKEGSIWVVEEGKATLVYTIPLIL